MADGSWNLLVTCRPCKVTWAALGLPAGPRHINKMMRKTKCPYCSAPAHRLFMAGAEEAKAWEAAND